MARRRPGETDRAYIARLRAVIIAARSPEEVLTADEKADRALSGALCDIQHGGRLGVYMNGSRLDDYRRIEAIAANLVMARALGVPDVDARTAAALEAADRIAAPWRGWEE